MAGRIFDVRVTRDGAGWTADVVNLARAHTWAPTKAELPAYVDEVIRLVADLPDDAEFAVRGLPDGDEDLERYRITSGTVFEEVDLDEEEVYLADGRRLTEELAEQIGEAAAARYARAGEQRPRAADGPSDARGGVGR